MNRMSSSDCLMYPYNYGRWMLVSDQMVKLCLLTSKTIETVYKGQLTKFVWQLGRYVPSPPSTKELHCPCLQSFQKSLTKGLDRLTITSLLKTMEWQANDQPCSQTNRLGCSHEKINLFCWVKWPSFDRLGSVLFSQNWGFFKSNFLSQQPS